MAINYWLRVITICLSAIVFSTPAAADLELSTTFNTYHDKYLSASNGFKLNYLFDNGLYLSGEYTGQSELRYGGQDTAEVFIYSLSIGLRANMDFKRSICFAYAQAGYYQPYFNYMSSYKEAFHYRHAELLHGVDRSGNWAEYNYELHPGIGGELGFGIDKGLSKSITFSFFGGYRVLKLREVIRGWGPAPKEEGYWKTRNDKDFGGYLVGISLGKAF